ncbi:MAG: hypothetical protein R3B60_04735 [Candidatus Paceibacterota bacterium]
MHLLGTLGINIWLLIAQIINFALLLWIMNKLIYKPLINRIEKDEAIIDKALKTEAALVEKEKKLEQKQKRYETKFKNKAKLIISEAEEIAEEIKKTAKEEAEQEKSSVLAQIHQRLREVDRL